MFWTACRVRLPRFESLGTSAPLEYDGFQVSRNSFFQVNRFLIDRLVECAIGGRRRELGARSLCGRGALRRALGRTVRKGHRRRVQLAAPFATWNITSNTLAAENKTTSKNIWLRSRKARFDPGRSATRRLGKHAVKELARIRAPRLTIVSCDPATLARDLQGLLAGGYRIDKITLVDLFPQTFHIETVVHLVA